MVYLFKDRTDFDIPKLGLGNEEIKMVYLFTDSTDFLTFPSWGLGMRKCIISRRSHRFPPHSQAGRQSENKEITTKTPRH